MSNYYLCPRPFRSDARPHELGGWAKEFLEQGRIYLRMQPAHPYIQDGMDVINGISGSSCVSTLSNVKTEAVVRNIKELVASQTNIRIIPAFKTEIKEFVHQQTILNKAYMAWQTMTFADRTIRKAWQYAGAAGTGYVGTRWEPNYWYKGKGEIVLDAYGPLDVLPVGLPRSHNLQNAYGVAIRVETPIHEAIRRYPEFADQIRPSRETSKGRGTVISQAVKYASAVFRRFGPGLAQENEPAPWETTDLFYIYIDDDTINDTGQPILMGDPGTTWSYTVPSIGDRIITGQDGQGRPVYRDATPDDCLLYPNRRKIVVANDGELVLTPNPTVQVNEYWHGRVPIVQFRADDWPWGFLGFPLTKAGMSLEKANIDMMRGMVDSINVRLSPPRAFDRNTMSYSLAQTLNTRIPNQVVGLDLTLGGEQIRPLLPPQYYDVPPIVPELIQQNESRIAHQMGTTDAAALSRARQLPSGDSLEKMMETLGPIIKDQSRNMESSVRDMGEMWKFCSFQFYSAPRRMQMLGQSGLVEEDFDYDPGSLIPSQIDGQDLGKLERARRHANSFTFTVTPYSLHELNSITRKLFHLQLVRAGFPIDWWTMADLFDLHNFGPPPKVPDPNSPGNLKEAETIFEKWVAQMEIQSRFQAAMMQTAAQMGVPVPGKGQGMGGGRPPTAQDTPTMEMKSDARSTIRESKR